MNMIERRKRNRGQGGFTLIELLVVVAILAVLGGVAVFAVGGLVSDSAAEVCKLEGETLQTAHQAQKATSKTDDNVGTYLDGGTASLTYFDASGGRVNTTDVSAALCPPVTLS